MRKALILAAALTFSAAAEAKPVWMLNDGKDSDVNASLYFGVPDSPEEVDILLMCHGGGGVEITILRTSEKVKSGTDVTFTMTVGKTKAQFHGAAVDNQLDGIATAVAHAGVRNPVLQALTGKGDLLVEVGGAKISAPLASMGKKAKTFLDKCKSNM
jgi:hypothetical protein